MAQLPLAISPPRPAAGDAAGGPDLLPASALATPSEVKALVNRAWPAFPKRARMPALPPVATLTARDVLSFHAQFVMEAPDYQTTDGRRRLTGKAPPPVHQVLCHVRCWPDTRMMAEAMTWEQRRQAGNFLAAIYALHLKISVRQARDSTKDMWSKASEVCKEHCFAVLQAVGMPIPCTAGPKTEDDGLMQCFGVMATWQTKWGRDGDCVGRMAAARVDSKDMQDIARQDVDMLKFFNRFAAWIRDSVADWGFEVWACSMELNSEEAVTNRVHLHAYLCKDWRKWKQQLWQKATFQTSQLVFELMRPHLAPAALKHNANPIRVLPGGLYYVLAPKIGSLHRLGNVTVFKEPCAHVYVHVVPFYVCERQCGLGKSGGVGQHPRVGSLGLQNAPVVRVISRRSLTGAGPVQHSRRPRDNEADHESSC